MKQIDLTAFVKLCFEVGQLTDCNDHTMAVLKPLQFFEYYDLILVCSTVKKLHDNARCISTDLIEVRKTIRETMLINVFNEYGKDVYTELKKCY